MAGEHGGSRPGSGRKPKSEKFAGTIARCERRIADRLPQIIDKMFELADGVVVMDEFPDGTPNIYRKPPDFKACAYLADRILGKPTERQEIAGAAGGPLKVIVQYVDPNPHSDAPPPPRGPEGDPEDG